MSPADWLGRPAGVLLLSNMGHLAPLSHSVGPSLPFLGNRTNSHPYVISDLIEADANHEQREQA